LPYIPCNIYYNQGIREPDLRGPACIEHGIKPLK
jgi:hypothetical protein